ncbi:aminoacyl-tRNA hydrolase [Granulimonas faecalis]|uniref:aminoacyl-tRNA hydrolase n=1 Tax=Granulimonas faecalis TaxID=2894155 RepID=UPI003514D7E3
MAAYKAKQMIVMRRDLKMRKGKIAAQAGHACVDAVLKALAARGTTLGEDGEPVFAADDDSALAAWFSAGVAKVCVYVDGEEALLDVAEQGMDEGFVVSLVRDAGITEFHGEPTYTCLAFEPLFPEQVDPITGDLPLY